MKIEYAIIIKGKTRLESLIERFNTRAQAQFYIERSGGDWNDYETEHANIQNAIADVQLQLSQVIKNKVVDRNFLPSFIFSENQLVIVVGQDGLVANAAKYVNGLPIVAVNPDPERYDGVLLPFHADNFVSAVKHVVVRDYQTKTATMAEARMNDGQRLLAFNDLFIGASSHVSARYKISFRKREEEHSSSGILVSTKSGATGWLSSVYNMTCGMNHFSGAHVPDYAPHLKDEQLMFVVREPFRSKMTQSDLVAGLITSHTPLIIESHMPMNGVIFSDGIESDYLKFNSGSVVTIGTAKEKAELVVG